MRLSRRLLFGLLPTLLLVGGLELAGRALPTRPLGFQGLILHPERGWTLPPASRFEFGRHIVQTNRLGLRGPEPAPSRLDRVLVLGDSTPFGDGVGDEETFASRLAQITGHDVQNGGVPGYTCPQSLHRFRELLEPLQPEQLVVYSLINDARPLRSRDEAWLEVHAAGSGVLRLIHRMQLERRIALREPRVSLEGYRSCLRAMITEQRAGGGETLLVVPVTMADFQNVPAARRGLPWRYRQVLLEVSQSSATPVLDLGALDWTGFQPPDVLMLDEVHPSAEGHQRIAARIAEALSRGSGPSSDHP